MTRRSPIRAAFLAAFALLAIGPFTNAAERPNVVLMMADDLGWGDLSCYGSTETKTPNLDRLAADGVRFTDFYAACGVCSPSRASFMTGRFCVRAGVYSWIHPSHRMHLRREETTIGELAKSVGYETCHVGKWHLSYDLVKGSGPNPTPGDHGFDHWMATGNNASPSHAKPNNFVRNGVAVGKTNGYSCQLVVDEAIGWLDENRDPSKPFYLNVWFHEPHQKVAAPKEYRDRHLGSKNPDYYGCIENMDHEVGRLMAKLDAMGVADNTFVVFTSDNGSYMAGSNGELTGRKTTLWEGGIREPGIIRWPGKVKPGTVEEEPAGLVDLLPTVCEVIGAKVPADRTIDGVSLVPLVTDAALGRTPSASLENRGGKVLERPHPLYWFYNPSRPVCVIRDGDYCLIADPTIDLPRGNMFKEEYIGPIKETGLQNFRLYNLRNDTGQKKDLAEVEPDRHARMKQAMLDLHADVVREAHDWRREK